MSVCLLYLMESMSTKHLCEIEFSCLCFHNYFTHSMYAVNQIYVIHHKRSSISVNVFANCDFNRIQKLRCLCLQIEAT